MPDLDATISATTKKLEQQLRRKAIAEYAAKEKERKAQRLNDAANRKADAHRKIELGGLVIAADASDLDPALIVGALLAGKASSPETLERLRNAGFAHLQAREADRKAARGKK